MCSEESIKGFLNTLIDAGVPINLANQCAVIVAKDDYTKPNLGRTEEEQHLINSSLQWLKAKRKI